MSKTIQMQPEKFSAEISKVKKYLPRQGSIVHAIAARYLYDFKQYGGQISRLLNAWYPKHYLKNTMVTPVKV